VVQETVTKHSSELKAKYETAKKKKLSHAELINAQVEEFEQVQLQVLRDTDEVRRGLKRLSEIALKDDPLSHVDYIDTLIRSEQQACKPGWAERVKQLHEIRKQAIQMQEIVKKGYDPFRTYNAAASGTAPEAPPGLLVGIKRNVAAFLGVN